MKDSDTEHGAVDPKTTDPGTANEEREERELKFAEVELSELRSRLVDMEAERVHASGLEENWILDRDGELEAKGCVLRLRDDSTGAQVTFKGPARYEGSLKVRVEHESEVGDPEQLMKLFLALGYRVVRRYQKMREHWRLGGVDIALDHTPIGDFAEFEGDAAEALAKRCGFDPEAAERRNYLRLYADHLAEHPDAPRDMVFEDDD